MGPPLARKPPRGLPLLGFRPVRGITRIAALEPIAAPQFSEFRPRRESVIRCRGRFGWRSSIRLHSAILIKIEFWLVSAAAFTAKRLNSRPPVLRLLLDDLWLVSGHGEILPIRVVK